MSLHIINQSPRYDQSLERCLAVAQPGDAVLFIDRALERVDDGSLAADLSARGDLSYYALRPALPAQELSNQITNIVQVIDYSGFVDLAVAHHPVISW